MSYKGKKIIVFIVITIVVVFISVRMIKSAIHDKSFADARDAYRGVLNEIESYRDADGIIKSIEVNTDFYDSGDGEYYTQVDWVDITVSVSNDVEHMSDQNKCDLLHSYQVDIEDMLQEAREQSGYEQIINDNETSSGYVKYKGRYAAVQNDYNIDFVSSNYEYAFYPNHFYVTKPNMGGSTEYSYTFEGDTLVYFNDTESEKKKIGPELPYVGMREEYLEYTSLGKADSVEKCKDFYKLQTRAQYTTYEWERTDEHGWYKITVRYRMHRSHKVDDYVDLPTSNGYVSSITYTDENGQMHTENYVDTY
ncbi:MAG: hypothetical protein IJN64_08315 [Lachnospiraceae bacterium]|nr:hypothetical protein [Lachnospiraceae bacterium]